MIEISKGNSLLAEKIVCETTCPSFSSILAGIACGNIWVNDLNDPIIALVYSYPVGGFRILGKMKNGNECEELIKFLEVDLLEQLKSNDIMEFEFASDDMQIEKLLLHHFSKYKIIVDQELAYVKTPEKIKIALKNINDYEFLEVDEKTIEHNFSNKDFLEGRTMESWGSLENYFKYGKSFIAIDGDKIIGVIMGTANYNKVIPIDIETLEEYQQKGVATDLTNLFLEYCEENQMTAYWNCMKSNISSRRIPEKLGFKCIGEKNYYYFSFA